MMDKIIEVRQLTYRWSNPPHANCRLERSPILNLIQIAYGKKIEKFQDGCDYLI
jgi:hypothetical protein